MAAKTAGYSGTPLPKKLGIKPDARVLLVSAPDGFDETLGALPEGVRLLRRTASSLDVVVLFSHREADLRRRLPKLADALAPAAGLWLAWPKKASKVPTDLSFDVVQAAGLGLGLVDNKVCAVDEVYSGLRFVIRLENR